MAFAKHVFGYDAQAKPDYECIRVQHAVGDCCSMRQLLKANMWQR